MNIDCDLRNMKITSGRDISDDTKIKEAEDRYLNLLSPELQEEIRKQQLRPRLPVWPENTRGVPNLCLRSALFRVIRRGKRTAVKGEIISSIKGLDIRYTGWQLDQGDFDVLMQAFHLQNNHIERTSDNYIRFQIKSFLSAIGRQPGKSGRDWLKDCFHRLTATALEINLYIPHRNTNEKYCYVGSLVDEFYYNNREQTYFLKINPQLAVSFDAGWTQLQWQQRLQLKTNQAKWLHGFYSSHREPFPIKIITLKRLCGSECKRLVDFRRSVRKAMNELINVGAVQIWTIDASDKLHVQRFAKKQISRSQTSGGHSTHT